MLHDHVITGEAVMKYCWGYVDDMIEYRQALGYTDTSLNEHIKSFSRYLKTNFPEETFITKDMAEPWCMKKESEKNSSFKNRMCCLRQFQLFLAGLKVTDYIFPVTDLPRVEKPIPYLFSEDELLQLFHKADEMTSIVPKLAPFKYQIPSVLFRVSYYCGLRPSEARNLLISDVDFHNNTLLVRTNKAHRERLIPIDPELTKLIRNFVRKVYEYYPLTTVLFPNPDGKPYSRRSINSLFNQIWRSLNGDNKNKPPHLYSFRHCFATNTLIRFMESGEEPEKVLPYLSSYMGHQHFEDTAYYIHLIPDRIKDSSAINWSFFEELIPEVPKDEDD